MPRGRRTGFAFLVSLCAFVLAVPAADAQPAVAAAAAPHPNDDCAVCHDDASAARGNGQSVHVDASKFAASVHGQIDLKCVDCHADIATADLPHAEELAPVVCATCHDDASTKYTRSAHAKARAAGQGAAATCVSCHGMHDILSSKDADSRTNHFNLPKTCGACHGDDRLIASARMPGGNVMAQFEDSIHGQALTRGGLVVAPSCVSCHGAHDIRAPDDPGSRVARSRVPQTCGTCHEGIERRYRNGQHGHELQRQNTKAPVCNDCHSAHGIQRADRPQWQLAAIQECGTCHREPILTYRDTFHGQVTSLGYAPVAKCADCHGAHEVLPASNPKSPVNPANRVRTCQKCHPGANAHFAQYDPHADRHDRESGLTLYYTGRFMDVLLAGVFGFFGIHSSLWLFRSWRVVREGRRAAARPEADRQKTGGGAGDGAEPGAQG